MPWGGNRESNRPPLAAAKSRGPQKTEVRATLAPLVYPILLQEESTSPISDKNKARRLLWLDSVVLYSEEV
jgi:hypothetical protein